MTGGKKQQKMKINENNNESIPHTHVLRSTCMPNCRSFACMYAIHNPHGNSHDDDDDPTILQLQRKEGNDEDKDKDKVKNDDEDEEQDVSDD